jgi:hypothetical protein
MKILKPDGFVALNYWGEAVYLTRKTNQITNEVHVM